MPPAIRNGKSTEVEAGEASGLRDHTRSRANSVASVPGASEDEVGEQTRIKAIAIRYRAERDIHRDWAAVLEEELSPANPESLKLREEIRKLQARRLDLQPTVEDPIADKDKRPERQVPQSHEQLPYTHVQPGIFRQSAAHPIP